ncbi:RNA helicase [Gracilaria domingensis]|nr:RNA helicase [Gracilaria domingensis]
MQSSDHFNFPGTPYDVQKQLMSALYDTIDGGRIGLFESPTGTGKTLSIICACLSWLSDNRVNSGEEIAVDDEEPDWVNEQTNNRRARAQTEELDRRKQAFVRRLSNSMRKPDTFSKRRRKALADEDDLFSDSEDETESGWMRPQRSSNPKIIFATRTHSQLTQFIEEMRKTKFGGENTKFDVLKDELPLSVVSFGSRKQLCIHDHVRALNSAAAISERCRELTEKAEQPTVAKRKRTKNHCIYKDQKAETILRDKGMTQLHTIEELATAGKEIGACPYFATRQALDTGEADVITVPYSAILHERTRRSLGIEVDENTVVVFDEAHNIVNTVCELHSSVLSRPFLAQTTEALKSYIGKYRVRFSPSNLFKLRQLLTLSEGLLSMLGKRNEKCRKGRVVHPSIIILEAGVDNINLYDLVRYMDDSRLCKKLRGFVDAGHLNAGHKQVPGGSQRHLEARHQKQQSVAKQSLMAFENFLRCLSDCSEYTRVAIYPYEIPQDFTKVEENFLPLEMTSRLKYFLVEPAAVFASSMTRAKAMLMLGGTLSPRSAIKKTLLKNLNPEDVVEFECNHVVPAENVITRICGMGPSNMPLKFTYATRHNEALLDELASAIESSIRLVEGGVVVFFSSYELLKRATQRWRTTGSFLKISLLKPVVVETRGANEAFSQFQASVKRDKKKGALLAAVMGGKLSEGINFSDELGRMVIVVGMPFANAMQLEISEVLAQMSSADEKSDYLENECLTIVNQSIGRAVRHRHDFASIVLMDQRFGRSNSIQKLPSFVKRDLRVVPSFGEFENDVKQFFSIERNIAPE